MFKRNLLLGAVLAVASSGAFATPFTITAQLTGDARQANGENPENLVVDVTIVSDTTSNIANWTIDLNSPDHPDIKLDEFYFNLTGSAGDYSFDNISPTDWTITPMTGNVQGGGFGNVKFLFEAGNPGNSNVTNDTLLTFDMILAPGMTFDKSIFLDAEILTGAAGSGQLGAHLQSLTRNDTNCPNGCNTDSGFAIGMYDGGTLPPNLIPEPGTTALLGLGLLGLLTARRRLV